MQTTPPLVISGIRPITYSEYEKWCDESSHSATEVFSRYADDRWEHFRRWLPISLRGPVQDGGGNHHDHRLPYHLLPAASGTSRTAALRVSLSTWDSHH